jgi:glycosyltransferase involved in cell wall biosynthesis
MRVLMFGWEFPPYNFGGLGTACCGLVKSLAKKNIDVSLVLPFSHKVKFAKIIDSNKIKDIKLKKINSLLKPYITSVSYKIEKGKLKRKHEYASSLFEETKRYAESAGAIAEQEDFDVIHAHDWLTFEAGIEAKKASKKPLIVHVHATEYDRTGGNGVNTYVYEIEKRGMEQADLIIAVSNFTKEKIVKYYGINSDKIVVVHNSVENFSSKHYDFPIKKNNKIVLFLGRITLQKGPDYFVYMAKMVSDNIKNVKFIVAGDGDMKKAMLDKIAELNLMDKFIFTGFLRGEDIQKAYKISDVYVMPSVSEPFGLTALESIYNKTPTVLSKQSGVSEVVGNALKVDFWDIHEMANKVISILKYPELSECLKENGANEIKRYSWDSAADRCIGLYNKLSELNKKI